MNTEHKSNKQEMSMKLSKENLQEMSECIFNNNWFSQGELEHYIESFLHDVSEKQAATKLIENGKAEIEQGKTKSLNDFMGEI